MPGQRELFSRPKCARCGQEIEWISMASGKAMPCDPGQKVLITRDGEAVRGLVPHWSTCPHAADFKKPNPRMAEVAQEAIERILGKAGADE